MARLVNISEINNKGIYDYYITRKLDECGNIISFRFVDESSRGLSKLLKQSGYVLTMCGCKAVEYSFPKN